MKMKITALTLALGMMCTFSAFAAGELRYGVEAEYPPFESRNTAGELEVLISTSATPSARRPS